MLGVRAGETMASTTLYDKYGGFAQVNRIVMAFYDALLDSEEIGPYFDDVDMKRLIDHQTKFISGLLGGPASFTDEHLRRAHAHLGVTPDHFDEMKRILHETLQEHGFSPEDADAAIGEIEARRDVIVL